MTPDEAARGLAAVSAGAVMSDDAADEKIPARELIEAMDDNTN